MPFAAFDRARLRLRPLAEREHDLDLSIMLPANGRGAPPLEEPAAEQVRQIAARVRAARERGAAVVMLMGGHVIRAGVSRLLIDLARRRLVTHFAGNGAVAIHDFEFALVGATTESVARYIRDGQFGLWEETGWLNEAAVAAARAAGPPDGARVMGWGEAIGRMILEGHVGPEGRRTTFPHCDLSLAAACAELGVPFTIHPGIGYDIIHEHPSCDGAAMGAAAYADFLIFARTIEQLEGGVLLNFGSAVMGPEVYLKALAMARNVAHQEGRAIRHFTTAVFDLLPLEGDYHREAPKTDPRYFYRPWKTILVRTVADGGESFYICGDHRATIPALWRALAGDE
jgi:hypothetical protein